MQRKIKNSLTYVLSLFILFTLYTLHLSSSTYKYSQNPVSQKTKPTTYHNPFTRLAKSFHQPPKYFHEKGNWEEASSHRDVRYGGDADVTLDGEMNTMLEEWTEFTTI
jgi:hypothetical protein